MGFYIRKAFNFGPIRLNLSRSGLGASFGVKGARVGVGPRGTYVHMGRGGFYYRQNLSSNSSSIPANSLSTQNTSYNLQEIDTADVNEFTNASLEDLVKELNRVKKYIEIFPIILIVTVVAYLYAYSSQAVFWQYCVLFLITTPILFYTRHVDVTKGTVFLNYEFESEPKASFNLIIDAFKKVMTCNRVTHIDSWSDTDLKYHGGATSGGILEKIRPCLSLPPRVQSNLNVPTLPAGKQTIYFFPEQVLIFSNNGVGAISYKDLKIDVKQQKVVAMIGGVPFDAKVVGSTWKYVNKKGGPDRRFKDNPELSIVLYDKVELTSSQGLNHLFFFSRLDVVNLFVESLKSRLA